jgi:hypothetical protein
VERAGEDINDEEEDEEDEDEEAEEFEEDGVATPLKRRSLPRWRESHIASTRSTRSRIAVIFLSLESSTNKSSSASGVRMY